MEIVPYEPRFLDALLRLCRSEGWTTFAADPERAGRAMTNPGVTALVAVEPEGAAGRGRAAEAREGADGGRAGRPVGFAQAVGDGCFGGYLCMLLVEPQARGRGIGRALVERTLAESGVLRLDLLSSDRAMSLYERFPHNRIPGFRLYPDETLRPPDPPPPRSI
ncbi:MAG TPA: GNAT family N-acetyltransferase [Solirubrobacterales bacterium]|nr:GNAT family N-acetyltransferase [Solirubrobacterales bacterium]